MRWWSLLLFGLLLSGCGSDSSCCEVPGAGATTQGVNHSTVLGRAVLEAPVANSRVAVQTLAGEVLGESTTTSTGTFQVRVPSLPRDFRVRVEDPGGRVLWAEARSFEPGRDAIHLSVGTTLASLHLQARAGVDLPTAEANVKAFLKLSPTVTDLGQNLRLLGSGFSDERYQAEAARQGGHTAFTEALSSEVGTGKIRSFADVSVQGVGGSILQQLASGSLRYLGGIAAGWLLNTIGISTPESRLAAQVQLILQDLQTISNQLQGISTQLNAIIQLIQGLQVQGLAEPLNQAITFVNATTEQYANYSSPNNLAPPSPSQILALAQDVWLNHKTILEDIHVAQLGVVPLAQPGLLELLLGQIAPRYWTADAETTYTSQVSYYTQQQALALNLLLESLHYLSPPLLSDAEASTDNYFISSKLQQNQMPMVGFLQNPHVEKDVVVDSASSLMWSRDCFSNSFLAAQQMVKSSSCAGYSDWRLPTLAEYQGLIKNLPGNASPSATMDKFGFRNLAAQDATSFWCSDVTHNDPGADGQGTYWGYVYQALISLANGQNGETYAWTCCSNNEDEVPNGDVTGPYPYLMVRTISEPQIRSTSTLQLKQVTASNGTVSYQALVDNQFDVTAQAVWSVTVNGQSDPALTSLQAHVSNDPAASGLVSLRQVTASDNVVVSATWPANQLLSPVFPLPAGGRMVANATVPFLPPATQPYSVIVSPTSLTVSEYPFTQQLFVRVVQNSGTVVDPIAGQEPLPVTFTTPTAGVSVSPSGVLSVPRTLGVRTVTTVQAQVGSGANATVGTLNLILLR